MDWHQEYQTKLVSAEEAVKVVKSGDKIAVGWGNGVPTVLCEALAKRKGELKGVTLTESITHYHFGWHEPGTEEAFTLVKSALMAIDKDALEDGRRGIDIMVQGDYRTLDYMLQEERCGWQPYMYDLDVFMVRVSPPDKHGFCSFGDMMWLSKTAAKRAKVVIGEVNPETIRTYGDNYIHVSDIDCFVENKSGRPAPTTKQYISRHKQIDDASRTATRTDEEKVVVEIIGELVAREIVRDGDTLQMGVGMTSSAMPAFLYDKHDLGIHTEGIPGAIVDLVKAGVITGKYKTLHPGKVVATSLFMCTPEQSDYIDNNPVFELYGVDYINSLRTIMAHENLVAINNALAVDLTGQITSESIGPELIGSPGGQVAFAIGAQQVRGGRAVSVLPSTARKGKVSRIVAAFEPGTIVTLPRYYADNIVTEYGIARLKGKTIRERVNEMLAIAHPDFRSQLREEAKRLGYGKEYGI